MEFLDIVGIDLYTMVPIWINLVILYFILKRFLYGPITKILAERESQVSGIYDDARKANESAKNLEDEYTQKLNTARDEASSIIKQATEYAKKNEEQIIQQANDQAGQIIQKANAQIEQERKKSYENIKSDISELSVSIAQKIIQKEINAKDHEILIDQFIENVGEAK